MPLLRDRAIQYAHENRSLFLNELKKLVSIPSVSTEPAHIPDMQQAAQFLVATLKSLNAEKVQVFSTPGHPIVYGEICTAGTQAPMVLVLRPL